MKIILFKYLQNYTTAIGFRLLRIYQIFFLQINNLNLALQKNSVTIFSVSDKIKSMVKKIDFWRVCIENNQPEVFETLHNFLSENKLVMSREIKKNIIEHLEGLKLSFKKYFSKPDEEYNWISNPFNEEFFQKATSLSIVEKEKLIELSCEYVTQL